jgi:hypothetical protein
MVVLLLAVAVVHVLSHREGHVWGGDFAMYVGHARNLVEAVPYNDTGYLYNRAAPVVGPPTYPPGLPAILAPLYAAFGLELEPMKWLMVACFMVFLVVLALTFRRELPFEQLLALVAIVGLNHFFLTETSIITSDLPFMATVYLTFLLVKEAYVAGRSRWAQYLLLSATGLTIYASYATRSPGLLLAPSLVLHDLFVSRRLTLKVVLAVGLFAALAGMQSWLLHSDRHYLDQFGPGVLVLLENAFNYGVRWTVFWHNGYVEFLSVALFLLMAGLMLLGFVDNTRRQTGICEIFFVFYLGVILVWPSYQAERYLYPIFPLTVFYAFRGLNHPWILSRRRLHQGLIGALLVAVPLTYIARYTSLDFGPQSEGVAKAESVELFDFIRTTTPKESVVVFIKPRVMALYTRRPSSVYHRPEDDSELWSYFVHIGADYLVVVENDRALENYEDPAVLEYLREFAARNREALEEVFANADFTVYRIELPDVPDRFAEPDDEA